MPKVSEELKEIVNNISNLDRSQSYLNAELSSLDGLPQRKLLEAYLRTELLTRPMVAPGGWGPVIEDEEVKNQLHQLETRYERQKTELENWMARWVGQAKYQIDGWYQEELAPVQAEAQKIADSEVTGSDFASLRGRGPEFILEFTALVILIISATILGLSFILENQQIGTLLAAIAGYVLGKSATQSRPAAGGALPPPATASTRTATGDNTTPVVFGGYAKQPVTAYRN